MGYTIMARILSALKVLILILMEVPQWDQPFDAIARNADGE